MAAEARPPAVRARAAGVLRLLHPFPSLVNALLVFGLALLAGGPSAVPLAIALALAMLCLQFSIGAANDYFDAEFDARSKPAKPIPAGLVARSSAAWLAGLFAIGGLVTSAALGVVVGLLAAGMWSAGQAYNIALKRGPWAWLAYAVAFPLLPLYAWYGAAGELLPRYELLLPLAALAGPALQLANGVVDLERDRQAGLQTLAVRLGQRRSVILCGAILVVIHGLAWLSFGGWASESALRLPAAGLLAAATALAAGGLPLMSGGATTKRERGWQAQALSIALLAAGWLAAVLEQGIGAS